VVLTVGHRGASALAPENTPLAVRVAIAHRLDYVEVDVHLSRDRELVVHHDAHVIDERGASRPIAELTAEQLGRIPKGEGQVVPTLAQVIAAAAGRIGVYVELKAAGTADALGRLVRRSPRRPDLICGSFVPELVDEARMAAPEVPRSVLFRDVPMSAMIATCRSAGARYAHPCARPIDHGMIDRLHDAGLLVMTPHTNSPLEADHFRTAGADLIASDDPRILAGLRPNAVEATRLRTGWGAGLAVGAS
jgi:glycerophosphoryl diester phosphodiesterase